MLVSVEFTPAQLLDLARFLDLSESRHLTRTAGALTEAVDKITAAADGVLDAERASRRPAPCGHRFERYPAGWTFRCTLERGHLGGCAT